MVLWLVCTLYSLTVDNAILVPEPLADHVTNRNGHLCPEMHAMAKMVKLEENLDISRNGGLWGLVSQIWCEHVLWSNLDDQMY